VSTLQVLNKGKKKQRPLLKKILFKIKLCEPMLLPVLPSTGMGRRNNDGQIMSAGRNHWQDVSIWIIVFSNLVNSLCEIDTNNFTRIIKSYQSFVGYVHSIRFAIL
jgi:hypothetical protein